MHRAKLQPADITTHDGIPVTTVARMLLDLAAILDRDPLVRTIEATDRREVFDLKQVEAVIARSKHRRGILALRAALVDYRDPPHTRSELERDFAGLIRKAALPEPQTNVIVQASKWTRSGRGQASWSSSIPVATT